MLVICRETFMVGRGEFVDAGGIFDAESDVVRRYPAKFRAVDFGADGRMVEQATAAPGERRNLAHRLRPAAEPAVEQPAEPVAEVERAGRPWTNASKDEWVAYASTLGIDGAAMTKIELIDAVDAAEKG